MVRSSVVSVCNSKSFIGDLQNSCLKNLLTKGRKEMVAIFIEGLRMLLHSSQQPSRRADS